MVETQKPKLLEQCYISSPSPPHPDVATLPLTFLDIPFTGPRYIRRQFFYQVPFSTHHFLYTHLPSLKHSLSLSLQHFSPFAGNLLCPPPPQKPFIRCTADDSLSLTVVESHSDFKYLSGNHFTSLKDFDHLVPGLSWSTLDEQVNASGENDVTLVLPVAALQITVFPNQGFCIAITTSHAVDGSSSGHFLKSWASICASKGDMGFVDKSPPSYDRGIIKDPKGLESVFLKDYFNKRSMWKDSLLGKTQRITDFGDDLYKGTVVIGRKDIEALTKWVMNEWKETEELNTPKFLSNFVVTCGFVWTSWVKMRNRNNDDDDEEKDEYFMFVANCRNRLGYPIPATHFGNCITWCNPKLKRKEIKGEGGFLKAVKVIERAIEDMKKEPFKDAENWDANTINMFVLGSTVLVAGSPKFKFYDTDFGFGKPSKVEMMHLPKIMSIAESGSEEGGLEFGFNFKGKDEYEDFLSVIQRGLQAVKS